MHNYSDVGSYIKLGGKVVMWGRGIQSRAVGRSENPGVPVVIRRALSVPPG